MEMSSADRKQRAAFLHGVMHQAAFRSKGLVAMSPADAFAAGFLYGSLATALWDTCADLGAPEPRRDETAQRFEEAWTKATIADPNRRDAAIKGSLAAPTPPTRI